MKILILLFVFIYIEGSRESERILEQIKKSGSLKVKGLSNTQEYQNEQKYCFPIQIYHKNKRKGYDKIKKKYNTIKNKLINKQIINDGSSFQLIKQEVRMNNNQKIWKIKRSVCIITDQQYEVYLKKLLKKHQINKVSSGFSYDITQQDLLMKAFNDANRKAKQLLDKIDYKISKIQSITILNDNVRIQYPQIDLSSLYDPQVSSLSEQIKKSVSAQQSNDSGDNSIVQDVEVEIVFAVKKSLNEQDDQSSSEEEAHSEVNNHKNNEQSSQQL